MSRSLFILILALCISAHAQYTGADPKSQASANVPHCTVSGVVVNSVTGESLARAQVTMYGPESRTTLTDSDGHFAFEDVAQAMVGFQARKPGFNVPHRRVEFQIQACTANTADGVKVVLVPTGAIVGRIVDANGDPVDDVPVRLGRYTFSSGRKQFGMATSANTDYDGRFRIGNLDAGSYILIVGPSSPTMVVAARDITPVSYFPGVADRSSAGSIEVKAGARVEVNMTVNEVPAFKISGRVVGASGEARGISVELKNEAGDDVGVIMASRRESNEFTVVGVPAGTYRARATAYEREGVMLVGSTTVVVSRDTNNVQIPVGSLMTLNVDIRKEGLDQSSDGNAAAMVRLINTKDEGRSAYMTPSGNKLQRWVLKNVERGTYNADVTANGAGYVASARLGGIDLLREPVTIDSDQNPIEITVRTDSAQVSGTILGGSQALIIAIPSDSTLYPPRGAAYSASGPPKFQMNLAPGDYTIYAMDIDGLEYMNPKVMEKYSSYGVHVSLAAQDKKEITLTKIEVAQ